MPVSQMGDGKQFHDFPGVLLRLGTKGDFLPDGGHKQLIVRVLIHHADPFEPGAGSFWLLAKTFLDFLRNLSLCWGIKPGNQAKKGRFSAAVFSQQQDPFSFFDINGNVFKDFPSLHGKADVMKLKDLAGRTDRAARILDNLSLRGKVLRLIFHP